MSWIEWGVLYLAVLYLIFAVDDLIFDVTYWLGVMLGWWRREVLTQAQLNPNPKRVSPSSFLHGMSGK